MQVKFIVVIGTSPDSIHTFREKTPPEGETGRWLAFGQPAMKPFLSVRTRIFGLDAKQHSCQSCPASTLV